MTAATGRSRRVLGQAGNVLATVIAVLAVAAFLFLAVGPRFLGYEPVTMLTGSMAPQINRGDVAVTVPAAVGDLQVGDVITYRIPVDDQHVETHRVTGLTINEDGTTAVRTKGDANESEDPWIATIVGNSVDRHLFTVPYVGQGILALRQPVVLQVLLYGAPAALVLGLLPSIWRRDAEPSAGGK